MTENSINPCAVYTLREAAQLLGVNECTLYRHVRQGTVPGFRIGRLWRVYGYDLLALRGYGEACERRGDAVGAS